jgi:hypothetical protein
MSEQTNPDTPPIKMRPDAIVDWKLYVKHNVAHADVENAAFFANGANRGHFGSQLLIYEHIVIPTNDFAVVPGLIGWMGIEAFEEALDSEAISFQRRLGLLGYAGNGAGILLMGIMDTPQKPFEQWFRRTQFGDPAEAIELHLKHGLPGLGKEDTGRLISKVLAHSTTPDLNANNVFDKDIANESYIDIRDTPELKTNFIKLLVATGANQSEAVAGNRLPGIAPNQFHIAVEGEAKTPIQLVLKAAEVNMEIVLADFAGGTDLHVAEGTERLLHHKILRSSTGRGDGISRLLEINGIPDIRTAVASQSIAPSEIWSIRQERASKGFRKWLAKGDVHSSDDLERLYMESLEKVSLVDSLPVRSLRFIVPTVLGFFHPIAGVAVGATDSFLVSRLLGGYRPKLMFDRLGKLFPEAESRR